MEIPKEVAEALMAELEKMVLRGEIPAAEAERAQQCASKMFRLLGEYEGAGLVALGMVGETVANLLGE